MTEDEARAWIAGTFDVSRETWRKLDGYSELLLAGMETQNLISRSTSAHIWSRHIVDSAQLLTLARSITDDGNWGEWVDLGAGAGLPGIVVAILTDRPVVLAENRRLRVEFLQTVADDLGLGNVRVAAGRVEQLRLSAPASVISARAFAPLARLVSSAVNLAGPETIWLLHKGRQWQKEVASLPPAWQSRFKPHTSITDPDSAVLMGRGTGGKGR